MSLTQQLPSPGAGHDNPFVIRLRLLAGLEEPELAALDSLLGVPRRMGARTEIVRAGQRTDRIHVILDGWACRVHLLPDGRRQLAALLIPGDVCNLDALYLPFGETGIATLTSCSVAAVDRTALRRLAARNPSVADALGLLGAVESRGLVERNACLGCRSAREHLAHLLCELLTRLSAVSLAKDYRFTLPITQEEIGAVLGLSTVHVNRVLQSLRTEGLIEQSGHSLTICDLESLRQEAGFRPDYLHFDSIDRTAAGPRAGFDTAPNLFDC